MSQGAIPVSRSGRRWWRGVLLLPLLSLVACNNDTSGLQRPDEPVVLTGASLSQAIGRVPGSIVAFAHSRGGEVPAWNQIPVQVDERKVVPFGSPSTGTGVTGTVYGSGAGPTALQYADPNTFVGADTDATFDADDELVFMAGDAGGVPRAGEGAEPPGVIPGSGIKVEVADPLASGQKGWVYLFTANGSLAPGAGRDYVQYAFNLDSGSYKSTYKRVQGPNPETSSVTTANYRVGLSDRWIEDSWKVLAGAATGVDILDGVKAQFALSTCGRSNATFRDAEGAFAANIDGPVRAIRSFIGANSGPYTERTHLFYRDRAVTITDLRVHAIPAIMDYIDLANAATGMTYASSEVPAGVPVNGSGDAVGTQIPTWQVVNGAPGAVQTVEKLASSLVAPGTDLNTLSDAFYRDELNSTSQQCWGDPHLLGAHGTWYTSPIANTDPASSPFGTFQLTRTNRYAAPYADTAGATAATAAWAAQVQAPLTAVTSVYVPPPAPTTTTQPTP